VLRRRRYAVVGGQEILMSSGSWWERSKYLLEVISKDKTLIYLDREYFGQKEAWLALGRAFDKNVASKEVVDDWIEYLSNKATRIEKLRVSCLNQELLDALQNQPQITELFISYGSKNYSDLTVLGQLPRLRKLEIEGFPEGASLDGLAESGSLKELKVFSRKPVDFSPLPRIKALEKLEIGTGVDPAFRKTVKVSDLKFLPEMTNLTHLHIYALVPEDRDLSPLMNLTALETGWYTWFRGQKPSVEELSKVNPVFAKVYATYLEDKNTDWSAEIPIITKWTWKK
jgi:hypothetical protein